ncbi:PAS domain S-box protein [Aestuariivirga sp.]|uniref:PAS domain S-box protein n=1 Tax=Aestuariivirga sp. TaxID=2650926 RepID=UPI003BAA03D6
MTPELWLSRLPRLDGAAAVAACLLVMAAAVAVRVFFPLAGPFISFYPAVLFCSLAGGWRLGAIALAVGLATSLFFFAPPLLTTTNVLSWLSFAVFSAFIVTAIDIQQRTLARSQRITEDLRRQQRFTDQLISTAAALTYIYDLEAEQNVFISPQCRSMLGYEPDAFAAMGSRMMVELLHPDDAPRVSERFQAMLDQPDVAPPDLEYRMRRKDGSWVWLLSSDRVLERKADGKPRKILGTATDISARKRFEEQLLTSEERFRGIFENAPIGISISDINGNFLQCNPAYERILGYSLEELRNAPFATVVHPDDRPANLAEVKRLVAQEVPFFEISNRSVHKSGRSVWVHKFVLLLRDRLGTPVNIVALVTDMTERKRQEEQIRLLVREVNHRSKNLLAVVQSVARQTAAYGEPADFAQRFSERLQGLSASHDLLVSDAWMGISLRELVLAQLAPFKELVGWRIAVSGPPLRINAAAAQNIGMAIHELCANAGRFGALSNAEGQVKVAWRVEEGPEGPRLDMDWQEEGGPPVTPPQRQGLGGIILTRLIAQSLEAEAKLDFAPHGLHWTLTAPLDKVQDPPAAAAV